MTFEVKQSITFVAMYPSMLVTKFGRDPIKHVEEEANCEKKERKKERRNAKKKVSYAIPRNLRKKKRQEHSKLRGCTA